MTHDGNKTEVEAFFLPLANAIIDAVGMWREQSPGRPYIVVAGDARAVVALLPMMNDPTEALVVSVSPEALVMRELARFAAATGTPNDVVEKCQRAKAGTIRVVVVTVDWIAYVGMVPSDSRVNARGGDS